MKISTVITFKISPGQCQTSPWRPKGTRPQSSCGASWGSCTSHQSWVGRSRYSQDDRQATEAPEDVVEAPELVAATTCTALSNSLSLRPTVYLPYLKMSGPHTHKQHHQRGKILGSSSEARVIFHGCWFIVIFLS